MNSRFNFAKKFWAWTSQSRPHWKESYKEAAVLFCVFGITGSSSVALIRPSLKSVLGIEGTIKDGPNSYRVMSVLLVSPIYACVLLTIGTLCGRHSYFANMAKKILSRFVPVKEMKDKISCQPAIEKTLREAKVTNLRKTK